MRQIGDFSPFLSCKREGKEGREGWLGAIFGPVASFFLQYQHEIAFLQSPSDCVAYRFVRQLGLEKVMFGTKRGSPLHCNDPPVIKAPLRFPQPIYAESIQTALPRPRPPAHIDRLGPNWPERLPNEAVG